MQDLLVLCECWLCTLLKGMELKSTNIMKNALARHVQIQLQELIRSHLHDKPDWLDHILLSGPEAYRQSVSRSAATESGV